MQLTRFLPLLPMPLLPVLAQDCQGPTEICSFAGRHLTSGNLAIEIQQFRNCLGNILKRYLNKSSLKLTKTYDRLSVELLVTILNLQRTESSKHCNLDSSLTQRGAMCAPPSSMVNCRECHSAMTQLQRTIAGKLARPLGKHQDSFRGQFERWMLTDADSYAGSDFLVNWKMHRPNVCGGDATNFLYSPKDIKRLLSEKDIEHYRTIFRNTGSLRLLHPVLETKRFLRCWVTDYLWYWGSILQAPVDFLDPSHPMTPLSQTLCLFEEVMVKKCCSCVPSATRIESKTLTMGCVDAPTAASPKNFGLQIMVFAVHQELLSIEADSGTHIFSIESDPFCSGPTVALYYSNFAKWKHEKFSSFCRQEMQSGKLGATHPNPEQFWTRHPQDMLVTCLAVKSPGVQCGRVVPYALRSVEGSWPADTSVPTRENTSRSARLTAPKAHTRLDIPGRTAGWHRTESYRHTSSYLFSIV